MNSGGVESWEAFAQARFTPAFLQQHSAHERAQLHKQITDRFGTIAIESVRRQGPDAPLQINVKGSKASGVIAMELDAGSPPRIVSLRIPTDVPSPGNAAGGPAPPINPSMTSAEIDSRLDAYFAKLAADDEFSGVALVARNGGPELVEGPVFFKAYGFADRDGADALDAMERQVKARRREPARAAKR